MAHNTQGTKETTLEVLDNVEHLKDLNPSQKLRLVDALCETTFSQGELIISKGDPGTVFYIIKEGTVECTGLPDGGTMTLNKGQYFGERALLLGEVRACNVTVVSPEVTCLLLDKVDFYELLGEGQLHEVMARNIGVRALAAIKAFSMLDDFQRQQVAEACIFQLCAAGEAIVTKGEVGDKFYVITQGEVTVQIEGGDDKVLRMGEYFGEQSLLNDAPRSATIVANNAVVCLTMLRSDFVALLGPLDAIQERSVARERRLRDLSIATEAKAAIGLSDLVVKQTLGRGTFGRVKLVTHKQTGEHYAMKVLSKSLVVAYGQQRNVINEKTLLMRAHHPFILACHAAFKDADNLYLLMELVQGGELFARLHNRGGKETSKNACFYSACVLSALVYLHSQQVAYRDLKPENLLIDARGYIKMCDFGFAKVIANRSFTLCGTPEYLAPELVLGKGHNWGVDYWALGILIYEMLVGHSPFYDPQTYVALGACAACAALRIAPRLCGLAGATRSSDGQIAQRCESPRRPPALTSHLSPRPSSLSPLPLSRTPQQRQHDDLPEHSPAKARVPDEFEGREGEGPCAEAARPGRGPPPRHDQGRRRGDQAPALVQRAPQARLRQARRADGGDGRVGPVGPEVQGQGRHFQLRPLRRRRRGRAVRRRRHWMGQRVLRRAVATERCERVRRRRERAHARRSSSLPPRRQMDRWMASTVTLVKALLSSSTRPARPGGAPRAAPPTRAPRCARESTRSRAAPRRAAP